MPIQNTITKEIMTVDAYKKRCELEDFYQMTRGSLREWNTNKIEQTYFDEFLNTELFDY